MSSVLGLELVVLGLGPRATGYGTWALGIGLGLGNCLWSWGVGFWVLVFGGGSCVLGLWVLGMFLFDVFLWVG